MNTPVAHLRDLRSELLLKLIIADLCDIDVTKMVDEQYEHIEQLATALGGQIDDHTSVDVVALWRRELSQAALRFLDQLRLA